MSVCVCVSLPMSAPASERQAFRVFDHPHVLNYDDLKSKTMRAAVKDSDAAVKARRGVCMQSYVVYIIGILH